jgi:hypothetical protein
VPKKHLAHNLARHLSHNLGHNAGQFVKHVLPAAAKPVHSLWHEILGFIFLAVAAIATWKVARNATAMGPGKLAVIIPFIVVTAGYGVSSFLKARRISRS